MNKTTNAGRHATGGQLARPGVSRRGQAEPAGNKGGGITGARPQNSPRPPVLTNQATTSEGAQRIVPRPPMPFENPHGSLNVKAPTNSQFRSDGNAKELRTKHGGSSSASIHNGTSLSREEMAAIGYGANDTKGTWSLISGHATKSNQRQAGRPGNRNSNTSAKENARMRQG